MLTTELSAGEQARLISGENVARARRSLSIPYTANLQGPDLARLRAILGADLVIVGSYLVLDGEKGRQIRLDLQAMELPAGAVVATLSEVGKEAELFDIVTRVGARLRRALGLESLSPGQVLAVQAFHPTIPEAARLTAEGLAHLRAYDPMQARGTTSATTRALSGKRAGRSTSPALCPAKSGWPSRRASTRPASSGRWPPRSTVPSGPTFPTTSITACSSPRV
jgi:hypothetical protein